MKRILLVLLLFVSIQSQAQWSQLNGPPGANIVDLERTSGGKLYVIASQTLYESSNNGATWQKTTITTPASNFYLDDLTINPTTGKMYALNYSQLYSSMDGTNWTRVGSGFNGMYRITRFGPDGFLAISGQNGVYVSKDDGITWAQILTDRIYNGYKLIANGAGDLFAATNSGIKRYLYPGAAGAFSSANWTTAYTIPSGSTVNNLTLGIDGSNNLYAQLDLSNALPNYDFIGSTAASNGTSWSSLVTTGMSDNYYFGFWATYGSSIYFFNNNAGKIYSTSNAFTTSSFSLTGASTTNGSSFIGVASTASLKVGDRITGTGIPASATVTQILNATSFYINYNATATNTGLTLTGTTLTTSWASSLSPSSQYGSYLSTAAFASASTYFLGSDGDGVFSTSDGGANFARSTGLNISNGTQVEVANVTGRIIYINNYGSKGYWTSADNGVNWSFVSLADNVSKILKLSDGTILLYGSKVYRSTDNGATFTVTADQVFNDMEPHPSVSGKVYAANNNNQFFVSTNSGLVWTQVTVTGMPVNYGTQYIAVNSSDEIYVLVYEGSDSKRKLYKITNGVASLIPNAPWLSASSFYPNNIFLQGGKIYVADGDAINSTSNDGVTWSTSNFSGNAVFPITQGAYSGIALSRFGTLYVTQDDGKSFNSAQLPTSNSYVTDMALDLSGKFVASAFNSPALKFAGNLTSDPSTLPTYIDFGWQPTNGPYGGYARELAVDNSNNVYIVTDTYSSYKANLAVTSWSKVVFPTGVFFNSMAFKKSTSTMYAVTSDRIVSSADGGTSWTIFNQEAINDRQKIVVCPNGVTVMVANNSIYATAANGNTFGAAKYSFTASERFYYYYPHSIISTSSNVVLIEILDPSTNKEKLKRSIDSGISWTDVALPNDQLSTISADNSGNLYVVNFSGIYKSADNGTTWTSIKGDITTSWRYDAKVNVSSTNELFICVQEGTGYRIKKSVNSGANWTNLALVNKRVIDINWLGTKIIAATSNGILTSTDGGLNFVDASTGITNLTTTDLYLASQNRLLVGIGDGTLPSFKSEDKGNTFAEMPYTFREFYNHPDGSLIGLVADGNKAYSSTDGGVTWTLYATFSQQAYQYFTPNGTDHYIRTYNDIYYSTNLTTWTKLTISGMPDSNNRELKEIAFADGIGYVLLYNFQTRKFEGYQILFGSGVELTQVTNPQSVKYYNNKIYLYGGEGTLAITADGSTWTKKSVPGGNKFIIATKEYYFITQYDASLWLSRNLGEAWQNVGLSGASASTFQDIVVNEYDGYAYATLANSVVRKSANVVIPDDVTAPLASTLSPTNNSTNSTINTKLTITFDEAVIPQAGKTLRILDLTNTTVPIETINVTAATQSGKSFTFTLTNPLGYLKTYFVVIDASAFKDIFGNSYAGILNNTSWRFTTQEAPDTQKPAIVFSTTNLNLEKGVNKTIEITVTDNKSVPTDKTKLFYRKITDPTSVPFTSADMTAGTGSGSGSAFTNNFTKDASENWYDAMGIEFYFETSDAAGNSVRSPSTADTYYYSYMSYTSDNTYPLLNSVLSFGGNQNNYRIITIPYKLSSTSTSTILNEIGGGAIDKTQWRLFTLGASNSYKEETTFTRGKGYWINVRNNPGNIKIEGSSAPEFNKSSFDQITLSPGWNMIGNPYPVDISWEETRAGNSTVGKVKVFNGSAYTDGDILKSLEGGFVNNTSATSVTLKIRFKGITTGGRTTKNEIGSDLAATKWLVPISAENNEIINALGGVGMHAEAKDGWDVFDDMNPPRFLEAAELAFVKSNEDVKKLAKDVVSIQDEYVWDLNVETSDGLTTLRWDNESIITNGKELMLFDVTNQQIVNMKEEGSYAFNAKDGSSFKIYFGTNLRNKIKPTAVTLSKPYPNPTSGESTIIFTLPEDQVSYQTRLEVYNTMGQRTTTLAEGNFASGFYTVKWLNENNSGGLYFYRLIVIEDGVQKVLTEKIIVNR